MPEYASQVDGMLSIYNRVCESLGLDQHDVSSARRIARAIIEASLAGDMDSDGVYEHALKAVLVS